MAMTQDLICPRGGKKVRMTSCEVCKGLGGSTFSVQQQCGRKGSLCSTHGKNHRWGRETSA
jgi:hypothetical protein